MPNLVPHPPRLLRTGLRAVIALLLAAAPGKAQVSSDAIHQVDSTGPVWRTGAVGVSGEIRADVMPELDGYAITRDRDYLQTSLEIGAVMAVGLGVYIYKGERNRYDWALTWDRVRERFTTTDHFRFDDNEFAMNNVAHPVAGALYYRFARANGFGPLGSALFSAGGSTFWEVVVELREVASLNDLLATPATGIALGEALHQHQDFFRRGAPTLRNAVLEKLLAGPFLVQRLYGDDPPVPADRLDRYGFPADRAHRFRVYGGPLVAFEDLTPSPAPESPWLATLGLSSEITSVEPTDEGGLHETGGLPLTRLDLQLSFSEVRPTEMHLAAETVLGGWRGGAIHRTGAGLRGFRWIVGPSTGFTMRLDHAPDTRFMDMQAVAHMLGLRTDWVVRRGRLRARWHGAAFADFSSVRPLGIERHRALRTPLPRSNSVLLRNLYYYAWGGTLRSGLEADLGPLGLRAEVDHHTFEAIRRRHRREDVEHSDLPMHDTRTYARGWLELRPLDGIAVSAGIEERRGSGTIGDVTLDAREARFLFRVSATP